MQGEKGAKKDITSILSFLTDRNPFLDDPSLRNIDTGTTADSRVNADRAKEIGTNISASNNTQYKNQYQNRWRTNTS